MLQIRPMRIEDIPFAIKLSDQEKWGVTRADLKRILRLTPEGSFVAYQGTRRLGITTATVYGRTLGWIGNVIVDKNYRGRHVGASLVEHALAFLRKSRVQHMALYCFEEHRKFYEKIGFERDTQFLRLRGKAAAGVANRKRPRLEHPLPLSRLLAADKRAFGADRSRLVKFLLAEGLGWFVGQTRDLSNTSYLVVKEYRDMYEFGPWVSFDGARDQPRSILRFALNYTKRRPVEIACLRSNRLALDLLRREGFRKMRAGYRMYFERRADIGDDHAQLALGFLDKG